MEKSSVASNTQIQDSSSLTNGSSNVKKAAQNKAQRSTEYVADSALEKDKQGNSNTACENASSDLTNKDDLNEKGPLKDDPNEKDQKKDEKSFVDQFYDAVKDVLGGTNEQQFLLLTLPGQSLNLSTFKWDYDGSTKPFSVAMQEFLLTEKLFDPCFVTGADNGMTLSHQYRSALDQLTPKLSPELAKHKNELREFLLSPFPNEFDEKGNQLNVAKVYARRVDVVVAEQKKFDEAQDKKKQELQKRYPANQQKQEEEFNKWFFTNANTFINAINQANAKVLQVFSSSDMAILEGILDSGTGAEVEQARRILNIFSKTTPQGGNFLSVQMEPSNWFELLEEGAIIPDALESPEAICNRISLLQTRKRSLLNQYNTLASFLPTSDDIEKALNKVNTAQTELNNCGKDLVDANTSGIKKLINTAVSIASCKLFPVKSDAFKNQIRRFAKANQIDVESKEEGKTSLLESICQLFDDNNNILKKQEAFTNACKDLSSALVSAIEKENVGNLKPTLDSLKAQISEIDANLEEENSKLWNTNVVSSTQASNNDGSAESLINTNKLPAGFMQVVIESDAKAMQTESTKASNASTCSFGASFFFCGASHVSSSAASHFESFCENKSSKIQIALNVAKVSFTREWFNPGVFALTKDMFRFSKNLIAPKDNILPNEDGFKAMRNCLFPCYPSAMVVARDITVRLVNEESMSSDFVDSCEQHSSTGGGILFFRGSKSSSSSFSKSNCSAVSDSKSVTFRFNEPQVIGYYLELTKPDKSTYISDLNDNDNVSILDFVSAYRKMMEQLAKQKQPQE